MKNNMKIAIVCLGIIVCLTAAIFIINQSSSEDIKNKIYVLNLNYDKGKIKLLEIFVKDGYYPDRKIQPEDGYKCEVLSKKNDVLYSFKFEVPIKVSVPPQLDGNENESIIYLENVNFTLLIPYFKGCKEIDIYDQNDVKLLSVDVSRFDSILKPAISSMYVYIASAMVFIILLFLAYKIFKKSDKWSDVYKKWEK